MTEIGPEIAGAIGLAVGVVIGLAVMRLSGRDWRSRIRALEAEYREEREAHAAYRASVSKHFADTSDLFRDLTRQYTALYAHLAEGARGLCPEDPPALASGYSAQEPVLPPVFESGKSPAESMRDRDLADEPPLERDLEAAPAAADPVDPAERAESPGSAEPVASTEAADSAEPEPTERSEDPLDRTPA
jgi:hypothetical protein